jgi:hypothetical protein
MNIRTAFAVAAAAGVVSSSVATGVVLVGSASGRAAATRAEAHATAAGFFRSINERRYDRTCALLSTSYYRRHSLDPARCAVGLRIGFMWSDEIRFRVTGVRIDGARAVVEALVDGVPGRLVLVSERGRFKVSSVLGS